MSCVRGCCETQAQHYKSVRLSGPSSRRDQDRRELRDMDAYARLRRSGVQPRSVDGSAELERFASTAHEVENKNVITDPQVRHRVTRAFEAAKELAIKPIGGPDAA